MQADQHRCLIRHEADPIIDQLDDQFRRAMAMRGVGAYEAKTHLAALLDAVAKGETIVITRRGRAIARLSPAARPDTKETARVIAKIKKARNRRAPVTSDEILSARDLGRR